MTSGLPPDAAVLRPAGTLVPEAVVLLPVSLVFVGTVLLSVVRVVPGARAGGDRFRWRPCSDRAPPIPAGAAAETPPRRATVSHVLGSAPGTTHRGRAAIPTNVAGDRVFPQVVGESQRLPP